MIFRMEHRDLFSVPQGYYLAHCISADFKLGAGIAKQFDTTYHMKKKLHKAYPSWLSRYDDASKVGTAILVDNVFNLVTKLYYYHKPTYEALEKALINMREQCIDMDIDKLAMPMIGCGLDRLDWDQVKEMISTVFDGVDIEILICQL